MPVGCLLLFLSILFIVLGMLGKISPDPFKNMKQYYVFMSVFLIVGIDTLIRSQGVDCQIELYKSNLQKLSDKITRTSNDCKMIGYDDLEKCPLMWDLNKNKEIYTNKLTKLLKKKYETN